MKKNILPLILILCLNYITKAQDSTSTEGHSKYYYPSGKLASEGIIRDGKPDGYWRSYYENGKLKSDGYRLNFKLDSIWRFYDDSGKLVSEIRYKNGMKNGLRINFTETSRIEEYFLDNKKQGIAYEYDTLNNLKKEIPFVDNKEHGLSYEFSKDKRIITVTEFRRGFIVNQEFINRFNPQGNKQGIWKTYYDSRSLNTVGVFANGLKHGFFKYYDRKGNLLKIEKYSNGQLIADVPELREYEIRTDYYPDGKIKVVGSYYKGNAEGVRREYDKDGKIIASYIMEKGRIVGKGLIDEAGFKEGFWQEFYLTGELKAEGNYQKNVRVKEWKFYHRNSRLEQQGTYNNKGVATGKWLWYYGTGQLRRSEILSDGVNDGPYVEYDENGKVLVKGEFIEGIEEGPWLYQYNDSKQEGAYLDGEREGVWKAYFYPGEQLSFEGKYISGIPDGKHIWYYDNGEVKEEGKYQMGLKDGIWKLYGEDGLLLIVILFEQGVEIKYDNTRIGSVEDDEDTE